MTEKTCRRCKRTLPLERFWKRARYKDGYNTQCKDCLAPTAEQRERGRAQAREWRLSNPDQHEANKRAYYERHPEKRAAKNAVYYALKKSRLERLPCQVCGDPASQAHHDDYALTLDVRWLCQQHHAEADVERRGS